ncbi:MAG: hypothetical protein AAF721_09370 [Myxococcota bacterium]
MDRLAPLVLPCMLLALGCQASTDDGGDDSGWTIDDPPRVAFTDETLPRMEVPADESTWVDAEKPLPEMGEDTNEEGILYSAHLMGHYQMRMLSEAEGFHYEYDPTNDSFNETTSVHRKVVSTFSLTWLYKATLRDEYRFAVEHMLRFLEEDADEQEDGSLKLRDLGATAMFAMALTHHAKFAQTSEWDETIDKVGAHVLSLVNEDGSLNNGSPLYYAQAHLGIWRLYDYTQDPIYLDTLEKVGKFHYDNRNDSEYLDSVHLYGLWAHEPLTELYMLRPADWITEFVFDNADKVLEGQYTPDDEDVDPKLIGSFRESDDERRWRVILKLEGTIDAYRLAVEVGDEERIEAYRKSSLLAVEFLQEFQYRKGDTDDWPAPGRAIGGTPYGFDNPIVRIEVPGHEVNGFVKVVEYMGLEDYPGRP